MLVDAIFDAHVHLRQGLLCYQIKEYTENRCSNAIVMPNTIPPIHDRNSILSYQEQIHSKKCQMHLTCKLLPFTTVRDVEEAKKLGIIGYKLYPSGATTNSEDGIPENWLWNLPQDFKKVLAAIQDNDMVLLHHGELPSIFVLNREEYYLSCFKEMCKMFPKLRMTLEHITTHAGVSCIRNLAQEGYPVLGTITLHHLQNNLNDLLGDKLRPDLFCKPVLKMSSDQHALRYAIESPYFAFGSDSAPHKKEDKYCSHGCAGIFSAPGMLESLYKWMEDNKLIHYWKRFVYERASDFYKIYNERRLNIVNSKWTITNEICGIVPYLANQELEYKIV